MPLPIIDPIVICAGTLVGEGSSKMVVAANQSVRYAITDLTAAVPAHPLDARGVRRLRFLADLRRWAAEAVHYVQLREKSLEADELFALAKDGMGVLRACAGRSDRPDGLRPQLLLNGRADIAAAAGLDGVHLSARPGELRPAQVREVFRAAGLSECTVSVSCHTLSQASAARGEGADLVLFGPVFEKRIEGQVVAEGTGFELLRATCAAAAPAPVLALGGVTSAHTAICLQAGAAGVAGIRLFA